MTRFLFLFLLLSASLARAETIEVVCKINKGDARPIPFRFVKNANGSVEMYRFDRNVNSITKGATPFKTWLEKLEITNSQIIYETKADGLANSKPLDVNSPLIPEGETRNGTISRVDGSWHEYFTSYGPWSEISGPYTSQAGSCEPRRANKF